MRTKTILYSLAIIFAAGLMQPESTNAGNSGDAPSVVGGKWAKSEKLKEGSVEKDGIIYTRYGSGSASCRVNSKRKGDIIQISILPKIQIDGESCVVDRIETQGFSGCSKLRHLTIPATIKYVDKLAFSDNKKLESVVCLSAKIEFLLFENKWGTYGVFNNSNKIKSVNWATAGTPKYAYDAFCGNSKAPYAKELLNETLNDPTAASTSSTFDSGYVSLTERPSFKQFAEAKVTEEFNRWQRKKEYETRGQYAERTSGDRRELKKKELFENARNEYINSYAPSSITGTLGNYDSDYKVYTISVDGLGDIFAQVPLADRSFFEDNWTGVEIVPTFDIVRNELKVVGCEYRLGDRTFVAPQIYNDMADSFSGMDFEASQIDLGDLLEETSGQQTAATGRKQAKGKAKAGTPVNNAPTTGLHNPGTYALIIGNENYKYVEPVSFALADATTFARYCQNTLGLPTQNIMAVKDVTKGELRRTVRELQGLFEDNGAQKNLIVYYAGHGIPDERNADSMILPVDASAADPESCYSLQELYNQLGELGAASVVVYMDACFTGSSRGGKQLMASRAGVDFVRSKLEPRGNMVVFSATSANETAQPYQQMGHGIFTYFLLEKLKATQGNVTLGELSDYVTTKVKSQSLSKSGKRQIPSTAVSSTFKGDWRSKKVNLM